MTSREHARRLLLILLANDATRRTPPVRQDRRAPRGEDEPRSGRATGRPEAAGISVEPDDWRMWFDSPRSATAGP